MQKNHHRTISGDGLELCEIVGKSPVLQLICMSARLRRLAVYLMSRKLRCTPISTPVQFLIRAATSFQKYFRRQRISGLQEAYVQFAAATISRITAGWVPVNGLTF